MCCQRGCWNFQIVERLLYFYDNIHCANAHAKTHHKLGNPVNDFHQQILAKLLWEVQATLKTQVFSHIMTAVQKSMYLKFNSVVTAHDLTPTDETNCSPEMPGFPLLSVEHDLEHVFSQTPSSGRMDSNCSARKGPIPLFLP